MYVIIIIENKKEVLIMKMTFRSLVAQLMMEVEEYGDCEVTDFNISLYSEDGEEFAFCDESDEDYDYDETDCLEMGFDPYCGCYTDDC